MDEMKPVGRPVKIATCGTAQPDPVFTNMADLLDFVVQGAKWAAHDDHLKLHALERIRRVVAAHAHLIAATQGEGG